MPLTIEQMADKMGLPAQSPTQPTLKSVKELESLRNNLPGAYNEIHGILNAYSATKKMKPKEMENMVSKVIKKHLIVEHNFAAAQGACQALHGLGTLAKSPKVIQVCNLTSQAITFAQNIKKVNDGLKIADFNFTALLAGGYIGALCTAASIAFSLFSACSDSPSIEQIMLEQLQAISEQIHVLRKEINQGFIDVHKHLDAVQEQIYKSTQHIVTELGAQIIGFRNEMNQGMESLLQYLEKSFDKVHSGQRHLALQKLRDLVAQIDAGTENKKQQDVLDMHMMLGSNWLLNQIGSPLFNSSDLFHSGNAMAAHESDIKALKQNDPKKLAHILGYFAQIAAEMDPEYERSYNPITVVNPYIFKFAANKLITLYTKYPAILNENEVGLSQTIEACDNTLDLFANINTRTEIWDGLFGNYMQAMREVELAITLQTATANNDFRSTQPAGVKFDIIDKLEVSLEKAKAGPILHSEAKCNMPVFSKMETRNDPAMGSPIIRKDVPIANLDVNTIKITKWPMQPELILASYFELCDIKATYNFTFKIDNHVMFNQHLHVLIKPEIPDALAFEITFEISIPTLQQKFKNIWSVVFDADYNNVWRASLSSMLHYHPKYGGLGNLPQSDFKLLQDSKINNPGRLRDLKIEAFQGLVLSSNLGWFNNAKIDGYNLIDPRENRNPTLNVAWGLQNELRDKILELRKTKIVKPLLNNALPEFKQALSHLDSARYRLLAFASMANLSSDLIESLEKLPNSDDVKNKLTAYLNTAVINRNVELEIPIWELPSISNIEELKAQISNQIALNLNGVHVPTPPEQLLQETKNELLECKNLFLPNYRASMPGRSKNDLQALKIDLVALDEATKDTPRRIHYLIVDSILKHDIFELNLYVQDYQELQSSLYIYDDRRITPLHVVACFGNVAELNEFRSLFAKLLDRQDITGKTPLMYAAEANNEAMVRALLASGAKTNVTDRNAKTALDFTTNAEISGLLRPLVPRPALRV